MGAAKDGGDLLSTINPVMTAFLTEFKVQIGCRHTLVLLIMVPRNNNNYSHQGGVNGFGESKSFSSTSARKH